jgi:hypothetical protein
MIKLIEGNQLANCPISKDDVLAAEDIFGKSIGALKGKTVWKKPNTVSGTLIALPAGITEKYRSVTLAFDIMFVNKVAFLVTVSRDVQFGTADWLASRRETDVLRALKEVVDLYKVRGFHVDTFLADGEFEPMRPQVCEMGGMLNTTSNNEHVGDVERYIRTIKERARSTFHMTPFKKIPTIMTQHLIGGCVFWLNAFPCERGISDTMSPRTIMTGRSIDYL